MWLCATRAFIVEFTKDRTFRETDFQSDFYEKSISLCNAFCCSTTCGPLRDKTRHSSIWTSFCGMHGRLVVGGGSLQSVVPYQTFFHVPSCRFSGIWVDCCGHLSHFEHMRDAEPEMVRMFPQISNDMDLKSAITRSVGSSRPCREKVS